MKKMILLSVVIGLGFGGSLNAAPEEVDKTAQLLLWQAIKDEDCGKIERAVEIGADIDSCDENGNIPLWFAAMKGKKKSMRCLLENKASLMVIAGKLGVSKDESVRDKVRDIAFLQDQLLRQNKDESVAQKDALTLLVQNIGDRDFLKWIKRNDTDCSVCLNEVAYENHTFGHPDCFHALCTGCKQAWFMGSAHFDCPTCRKRNDEVMQGVSKNLLSRLIALKHNGVYHNHSGAQNSYNIKLNSYPEAKRRALDEMVSARVKPCVGYMPPTN